MEKYKLLPQNLKIYQENFDIVIVDTNNYTDKIDIIQECIDIFNKEVEWVDMFDVNMGIYRIRNGSNMYIGLNNNIPFAYFWSKPFLNGFYLYNTFVSSEQPIRGKYFISTIISKYFTKNPIFISIDEWNIRSMKMFESVGFEKSSWVNISYET